MVHNYPCKIYFLRVYSSFSLSLKYAYDLPIKTPSQAIISRNQKGFVRKLNTYLEANQDGVRAKPPRHIPHPSQTGFPFLNNSLLFPGLETGPPV